MKLIIGIVAILAVSGCVTYEPYPDDWPDLQETSENQIGDCPDISGRYRDLSTAPDKWMSSRPQGQSLTATLYASVDNYSERSLYTVEIRQPEESTILVVPSEGKEFRLSSNEGHFSCKDGVINLGSRAAMAGSGVVFGGGSIGFSLFKAEDQSLVLKEWAFIAGLALFVPMVESTTVWAARWVMVENGYQVD